MSFFVRPACIEDCPSILKLIRELAAFEQEPDAVTVSETHFRESGFGERPVWWALVAEADGVVVGFALWYIRYSTWKGQRMYLEDLYVQEQWRRHGVGTALMDALIAAGKAGGFSGLAWQVLDWNEPALRFYRRLGAGLDSSWINAAIEF